MAKLSFKLRPASGKNVSIQLVYNYGTEKRLRLSTGLKLKNSKNWDSRKMRVKQVAEELHRNEINGKLNSITELLEKKYIDLTVTQGLSVDNDMLRAICNEILFPERVKKNELEGIELLDYFQWYLNNYQTNPLPTTGKPIGEGTLRTYKNTLNKLKKFDGEVYKLKFEKITVDFYDDFINWLYDYNYSANYAGTIIKILKTIMGAAFERDLHRSMDYTKKYFRKPVEKVYNIFLTEEELERLYNYDLEHEPTHFNNYGLRMTKEFLGKARDLFLIGAYTGLRVSDFNRLTEKNIISHDGSKYIEVTTRKNDKTIAIPVNWMVEEILSKNGGSPPSSMPNQHINYGLKKLGELAEINSEETQTITKGGKKVIKNMKKYELISNHTARRSFCTNAYLSEIPTIDIMAISGHSSEKVFYNYIKVDHLQRANKIRKHNFFSSSKMKIS